MPARRAAARPVVRTLGDGSVARQPGNVRIRGYVPAGQSVRAVTFFAIIHKGNAVENNAIIIVPPEGLVHNHTGKAPLFLLLS